MYSNIHYDLIIKIKDFKYNGIIKIIFENEKEINKILLDCEKINITKIKINNKIIKSYKINKNDITINYSFIKQKYIFIIHFDNEIKNNMTSLYYSKIGDDIIYSTDFEPVYARQAFPCFDEPIYKATFQLILFYDKKNIALSNTPEKNTYIKNDTKITVFEKTPLMSSYLLCFVIGDLHKISYKNLSAYCHKSINKEYMDFSLNILKNSFNFYNKYYDIKFPIKKLDIVCIPEFENGAMENWGLITFRDINFLYDKNYPELNKLSIENVINHELVHQWFGNLVSVKNWNNLWLNESFAEYMSNTVNNTYNQLILNDYSKALFSDSFNSSKAIYNEDYKNKYNLFNPITYSKGSCVIRYIENYIGSDIFRDFVVKYLKKYKYSNAETNDFINMIPNNNYLLDPKILMKNLISYRGFPIIKVNKNNNKYNVEIKLFDILNNDFEKLKKFPYEVVIEVKHKNNNKKYLLNSEKKLIIEQEIILINSNNTLFCTMLYEGFKPDIQNMNNLEILAYLCNLHILLLWNDELFEFINTILLYKFNIFIIKKIYMILLDFKKIFNIKRLDILENNKLKKIKDIIENILESVKDDEIINMFIEILVNIFNEKIDKFKNIIPKKFLFKIEIKKSNYEELLDIYRNYNVPSYALYLPEILCLNEKIYDEIINTLKNNDNSILRIQDISKFVNLFLKNNPEYINKFLLFLSKNEQYYLIQKLHNTISKYIFTDRNKKLLPSKYIEQYRDIIEYQFKLYNYF